VLIVRRAKMSLHHKGERQEYRKRIIAFGYRPNLKAPGVWDKKTALDREGRMVGLSECMRSQMRRMIEQGYFGPELAKTHKPKSRGPSILDKTKFY
jgi:hypothetical protein